MSAELEAAVEDLTAHLTSERQAWLFGAGISCRSGLPLMGTLTELVAGQLAQVGGDTTTLFQQVRDQLAEDCHIEHVLSQLGDLIALAERSRDGSTPVVGAPIKASVLRDLHGSIRDAIRRVIRYGYHPKTGVEPVRVASEDDGVVSVELHRTFIRALFGAREKVGRPLRAIRFFTLNYDTLLEDALALERVSYVDGFSGGAMAYWSPTTAYGELGAGGRVSAAVHKLHGSVDWHADEQDGSVFRCRDGRPYPKRSGNVLIYPQSTKYLATQKDPFARLFEQFRMVLMDGAANVLAICGYSFGDEHVDLEIEAAMARPESRTVIVAFAGELETGGEFQVPARLKSWLNDKPWRDRVFAVTSRGLYHGSLVNLCAEPRALDWWTFEGVTNFLTDGPQYLELGVVEETEVGVPAAEPVVEVAA